MTDVAVRVDGVHKRFRMYAERNQSLKAAMMRGGRAKYDDFWALKDVTLEIPTGSTYALIGENGSGKSTLLKCMARILRPERGTIAVAGKVSALLELGAGFHPELSGRDNVYLNASILGLSRKQVDARFDDIVGFAGLDQFIDSPVKNYSSGMYVRLGFSVAINVDPDVLLVDEVLAVGDETFQRRCNEKFAELKAEGRTIVVVSHALGIVRTMCDSAAWLEHGVVKDVGSPAKLIDDYIELTHPERVEVVDETTGEDAGTRWGSGEAQVERIELIDAKGRPTRQVRMGDTVTVRLHYRTHQKLPRAVFGLGIHRLDGVHVSGINSREALRPRKLDGAGHVDFTTERLALLPGTYDVTAAIHSWDNLQTWDHRNKAFRFDVEPGRPREAEGVVVLHGDWTQTPAK